MPDKKGRLNGMEQKFVDRYAASGDREYAAAKAGYSQPASAASKLLTRADVRNAVSTEVHRRLDGLVVLTLDRFEKMMADTTTPNKDVIAIGKAVMTHWGAQSGQAADSKDPAEMSGDELQRRIARLQAETAARAQPILDLAPDAVTELEDGDDEGVLG